jgi:hypothetical protein
MQPIDLTKHKNSSKWFVTQETIGEGDFKKGTGYWLIQSVLNNKVKDEKYTAEHLAMAALDDYLTKVERDNRIKTKENTEYKPVTLGNIKVGGKLINSDSPEGIEYIQTQEKAAALAAEKESIIERNRSRS